VGLYLAGGCGEVAGVRADAGETFMPAGCQAWLPPAGHEDSEKRAKPQLDAFDRNCGATFHTCRKERQKVPI